jgi:hypothetical protein
VTEPVSLVLFVLLFSLFSCSLVLSPPLIRPLSQTVADVAQGADRHVLRLTEE